MTEHDKEKMKQGFLNYSSKEKTIILNVFKYLRHQYPEKSILEAIKCTSEATGCREKSIYMFLDEEECSEFFKSKRRKRKISRNSRHVKYDNFVRLRIRNIIYDLKCHNNVTSPRNILKALKNDPDIPSFSIMTLRRLLFDMGYQYEEIDNKKVLVDKCSVIKTEIKEEILEES